MPPIDRIMPREVPSHCLSSVERIRIANLLAQEMNASQIARELGRAVLTTSRALRRSAHTTFGFLPFHMSALAKGLLHRAKELKVLTHPELVSVIEGKLRVRWSPTRISRYLKATFPNDPGMHLSHESIDGAPFRNKGRLHAPLCNSPQSSFLSGEDT